MPSKSRRVGIRVASCYLILMAGAVGAPSLASGDRPAAVVATKPVSTFDETAWNATVLGGLQPDTFRLALEAVESAIERGEAVPTTLTVIDFSQPSTSRRMWVYDLRSRQLLFNEFVSHGRRSGENMATSFSNEPESNMSSIGLFRAAESYNGKHGYSLRLDGLEPGFNDRARDRAVVIHGAEYVNGSTALSQGRLGRSLGCPAVRPEITRPLIDAVKDGGMIFAYYPDPDWLQTSVYLN
jgi:hypothetical protein